MCTEEKFHALARKVENIDNRLKVVETSITEGFSGLKAELVRLYDERAKWSAWLRDNLGRALKWLGLIVLSACGINQISSIVRLFLTNAN